MLDSRLLEAFHLMYDHYPESVVLINRKREIVALNSAAEASGRREGMKCVTLKPAKMHVGCQANDALRTQSCTYRKKLGQFGDVISFWLPISGYPDYLVHFSVGAAFRYEFTVDKIQISTESAVEKKEEAEGGK